MPDFNCKFSFDLRSSLFGSDSQFIVATGGPLSGKTTVLDALGLPYEPESARAYMERELEKGKDKFAIRADEAAFQRGLVSIKMGIEDSRPKDRLYFFDRGMPDSITYFRAAGLDPSSLLKECKRVRYAAVFHFDLVPTENVARVMQQDRVRTEDEELRCLLDRYLELDYRALGYDVIRVPFMSVRARVHFVLDALQNLNISTVPPSGS